MFNWIKNKLNNLIPKDINNGIMSCLFTTLKVGHKITIPQNICCFISYHDKVYLELASGSYNLDKNLIQNLYLKQQKGSKPLKKVKLDLFYVNLMPQTLKLSYTDKIPVNNKMKKLMIDAEIKIQVNNARSVYNFLTAEFYSVNSINSNECYLNYIEAFLRKKFLKIKLETPNITNELKLNLNEALNNFLSDLGMKLLNFNIDIASKNKSSNNEDKTGLFNFFTQETQKINNNKSENLVDQNKNLNYTNKEELPKVEANCCPKCGSKTITGSIFCHRCGQTLK